MSFTLRLFWEAAGGNVPEHWEFKTIDELLEHPKAISVGVMYPGSDTDGGVPLIKVRPKRDALQPGTHYLLLLTSAKWRQR